MRLEFDPETFGEFQDHRAYGPCAAMARGHTRYAWVPPYPCPLRGRYEVDGLYLCGHHVRAKSIELAEERLPEGRLPARLAQYARIIG